MRRLKTKCVCLLLTLATLAVPQTLLAATEWKVESTTEGTKTTFKVTRSGDVSEPAEVYYRTISLSAMAVYNYQARSGKWQFTPGRRAKSQGNLHPRRTKGGRKLKTNGTLDAQRMQKLKEMDT